MPLILTPFTPPSETDNVTERVILVKGPIFSRKVLDCTSILILNSGVDSDFSKILGGLIFQELDEITV